MPLILRQAGEHRVLTALVAALVLTWAAGCAVVDDDRSAGPTRKPAYGGRAADAAHDDHGRADRPRREARAAQHGGHRRAPARPAPVRTYVVTRVVDGDTLELGNGQVVRLVGIDTPEVGECGYDQASSALSRLTLGAEVRLTRSDEDRDRYGRLLRYVDVGEVDAGLRQIRSGLAIARYDSRDGYGYHPRERAYVAADRATRPVGCAQPRPLASGSAGRGCAPGYAPCVPSYPPDVDCADVDGPVTVSGTDPHALDGDGDGTACE